VELSNKNNLGREAAGGNIDLPSKVNATACCHQVGQVGRSRIRNRAIATGEHVAQIVGQLLQQVDVQISRVLNHIVARRLGRALDGLVADHEELHLVGMHDGAIDHGSGVHVVELVVLRWLPVGEEASVVTLYHDHTANLGLDAHLEVNNYLPTVRAFN